MDFQEEYDYIDKRLAYVVVKMVAEVNEKIDDLSDDLNYNLRALESDYEYNISLIYHYIKYPTSRTWMKCFSIKYRKNIKTHRL